MEPRYPFVQIVMDLYEISPAPATGLFLDRFRLSWIAFLQDDPAQRVLMDAHPPVGLHYHVDDGPQVSVELKDLEQAIDLFAAKVTERFGELEAAFHEDFHV